MIEHATPRVSVIIPAHQAERTIAAAVGMAADQTYPNVEVVVVDDGSTDRTGSIADALRTSCIRVIHQRNGGLSAARNSGIREATGDMVALCDADDLLLPGHVAGAVDTWRLGGGGRRMVTVNPWVLTPSGITRQLLRDPHPAPMAQRSRILSANFVSVLSLFPRAMIDEVGPFDETLRACEDWDLWMRAVMAGWQILRTDRSTAIYRHTGKTLSSQRELMYDAESAVLTSARARWSSQLSAPELEQLDRRLAIGSPTRMVSDAEQALRDGDLAQARRLMAVAAPLLPGQRRLRTKSALMRIPGGTHAMRRYQRHVDGAIGFTEDMRR